LTAEDKVDENSFLDVSFEIIKLSNIIIVKNLVP